MARQRLKRPKPTAALPGSQAKIEVLAARYAAGERLWHPKDAQGMAAPEPPADWRRRRLSALRVPAQAPGRGDGVSWDRRGWRARVTVAPGRRDLLGFYRTRAEAEAAVEEFRRGGRKAA